MSLADDLAEPEPPTAHANAGCAVGKLIGRSDPDDADLIRARLADSSPKWVAGKIGVGEYTVRRHNNGICCCEEAGLT